MELTFVSAREKKFIEQFYMEQIVRQLKFLRIKDKVCRKGWNKDILCANVRKGLSEIGALKEN